MTGQASTALPEGSHGPRLRHPVDLGDKAISLEVVAEKNNLLCDIQVVGTGGDFSGSVADQQQKIGALCNKIFAAAQ